MKNIIRPRTHLEGPKIWYCWEEKKHQHDRLPNIIQSLCMSMSKYEEKTKRKYRPVLKWSTQERFAGVTVFDSRHIFIAENDKITVESFLQPSCQFMRDLWRNTYVRQWLLQQEAVTFKKLSSLYYFTSRPYQATSAQLFHEVRVKI